MKKKINKNTKYNKFLLIAALLCILRLLPEIIYMSQEALYINIGESSNVAKEASLVGNFVFMDFIILITLTIAIIGGMIYKNLFALFISIFLVLIEVFLNLGNLFSYIYFLAVFGLLIAGYKQIEEKIK